MAARRMLVRLPALLGAAVIALGAMQIIWNGSVGQLVPRLHWHVKIPLGAIPDHPPPLSLPALLDGAWQRQVAHSIGPRTILYRMAVRWKTQFYYSVFGTSGDRTIGVGPDGQLFQWEYVHAFCRSDVAEMQAVAPDAAAQLRVLQDRLAAQGQEFLYLITPSRCRKPLDHPARLPLPAWGGCAGASPGLDRALEAVGVHYVDATLPLRHAADRYQVPMFPRGGTHWDALGGALAAQALTDAADAHGGRLTPFSFSVDVSGRPTGDDRDLYDMLNLVAPDDRYAVPLLTYQSTPPVPCRPQRIAQVAGSFVFRLNESLAAVSCPPEIHLYWYWDQRAFVYSNGSRIKVPMDATRRSDDLLRWADLVILEENEATIPASPHGDALLRLMAARVSAAQ